MPVSFSEFSKNNKGNMLTATALIFPVVLGVAALALDGSSVYRMKSKVQSSADAAALAAATKFSEGTLSLEEAEEFAVEVLKAELINETAYEGLQIKPEVSATSRNEDGEIINRFEIAVEGAPQLSALMSFVKTDNVKFDITSVAENSSPDPDSIITDNSNRTVQPTSLALALDTSGSMGFCSASVTGGSGGNGTVTTTNGNTTTTLANQASIPVQQPQVGQTTGAVNTITTVTNNPDGTVTTITETNTIYANGAVKIEIKKQTVGQGSSSTSTSTTYSTSGSNYYGNSTTSGIGCEGTKLEALKIAADRLFSKIEEVDPKKEYVRVGASTYNTAIQNTANMRWGVKRTRNLVNNMLAGGGTDSTDSMKWAYKRLNKAKEANEHKIKNSSSEPSKKIVFMTDGENNFSSADTSTKSWCDKAKAAGMEIYSIAFDAPQRGQDLLNYCASSPQHYFKVEDSDELILAFESIGLETTQEDGEAGVAMNTRLVK